MSCPVPVMVEGSRSVVGQETWREAALPASPSASVLAVIPCLNEEANLERLVHRLAANSSDPPLLIVIGDGGSTDRTPQIAQRLAATYGNVQYLHNPKRLQSAAVNLAVARYGAEAGHVLRLDAHADYPPNYCRTLLDEMTATGAAAVTVAMATAGESVFQRAAAAAQNSRLGNGGAAHRLCPAAGAWVDHGHHALMRLDAFRSIGGYDETFSHNEDAEFDIRLRRAGYALWLTAKTSLTYYPRARPLALLRQYFNFGRGRARTVAKHRTRPRLRQLAPLAVPAAALLALATPFAWPAALPLALWMLLYLGFGLVVGLRKTSVAAALAGPVAMLMHLGWSLGFYYGMFAAVQTAWRRAPAPVSAAESPADATAFEDSVPSTT